MVSLGDSQIPSSSQSPCSSSTRIQRSHGRSMRTIRSNLFNNSDLDTNSPRVSENLTDSVVDFRLTELAAAMSDTSANKSASIDAATDILELSHDFSDFSSFNSDISGELQRLAVVREIESPRRERNSSSSSDLEDAADLETLSLELVEPVIKSSVEFSRGVPLLPMRNAARRRRFG